MATNDTAFLRPSFRPPRMLIGTSQLERVLSWREDLITAVLAIVLVLGLYLDGWNHINLQANELGAFLTPWHGLLYLGYTLLTLWILSRSLRRIAPDAHLSLKAVWDATPDGYRPALIGIGMVSIAAPGDAVWHTLFGIETGVARVIGPFHLVLFTGMGLMVSTPLRSAWIQVGRYPAASSLTQLLPALISMAMLACTAGFLVQYSSSFVLWTPSLSMLEPLPQAVAESPVLVETLHRAAVSQLLFTTAFLMAPLLIAAARWDLPFGSATIILFSAGLLSASLNELALQPVLISTLLAGLAADGIINALGSKPATIRICLLGGLVPLVLWTAFFLSLALIDDVTWPRDLWLGATAMAGALSAILGLLVASLSRRPSQAD